MKWNEWLCKRHSTRKSKINKYNFVRAVFFSFPLFLSLSQLSSVTKFFVAIWNAQCAYLNVSTHFLMGNHYDKQRLKWTVHDGAKSPNHLTSINMSNECVCTECWMLNFNSLEFSAGVGVCGCAQVDPSQMDIELVIGT